MQMLVDKIWLSMPEMNRGPGYHTYHRTCSHLKRTKRVGQMDDFHIQSGIYNLIIYKMSSLVLHVLSVLEESNLAKSVVQHSS